MCLEVGVSWQQLGTSGLTVVFQAFLKAPSQNGLYGKFGYSAQSAQDSNSRAFVETDYSNHGRRRRSCRAKGSETAI